MRNPPRVILTSAYSNIITREDEVEAFFQKPLDTERLSDPLTQQLAHPPPGRAAGQLADEIAKAAGSAPAYAPGLTTKVPTVIASTRRGIFTVRRSVHS